MGAKNDESSTGEDGRIAPGILRWRTCTPPERQPVVANERMALVQDKLWSRGAVISIAFLDGSKALQERVVQSARQWLGFATSLRLAFGAQPDDAALRITFQAPGASSKLGTDALKVQAPLPTMKLGLIDDSSSDSEVQRVTLHEFGHALGCIHEHQSPAGGIPWNKPAVYAYFRETQGWAPAMVDRNVIDAYSGDLTVHSEIDLKSIMIYPIPRELTTGDFSVGLNTELSETDKEFIGRHYG